jgi:hypothetical protein
LSSAENKKVDALKKLISSREAQIATSKAKVERIESDMEGLRLAFEAKMRALEAEKFRSERYVAETKIEQERLIKQLDEKICPKVKLSLSDYTKLRTLKKTKLTKLSSDIDTWYNSIKRKDTELKEALEVYFAKDFHKIWEDDIIECFGKDLLKELSDKNGYYDNNFFECIKHKWDYDSLYTKLNSAITKKINEINKLLDNSESSDE